MRTLIIGSLLSLALSGCVSSNNSSSLASTQNASNAPRPVPSVEKGRDVVAKAIALGGAKLGNIYVGGRNPIVNASISGPKPYTDFLSKVESDVYCVKFTLKEGFLGMDTEVSTFAYVRSDYGRVSATVKSPSSVNLAGCLSEYTPFPEVESYNHIRAKRTNIFGL